jgi:hypothetical protein
MLGLKVGPLFSRFDALGNHEMFEALCHVNYGADDRRVIGIGSDLVDKGLVNFQDINGETGEDSSGWNSRCRSHPLQGALPSF